MPRKRLGPWEYGIASTSVLAPAAFVLLYGRFVAPLRYPAFTFFIGFAVVMALALPAQSLRQKRRRRERPRAALPPYRIAVVLPYSGWPFRIQMGNKQTLDGRRTMVQVFKTVNDWLASDPPWHAAIVYESFVAEIRDACAETRIIVVRPLLPDFPNYSVVEFPLSARSPAEAAAHLPIDRYAQPDWARARYAEALFMLTLALAVVAAAILLWLQPN